MGGVVIGLCIAALLALWAKPPDLIRIGSNYTAYGIPEDTFRMSGHDGQYVAIIPSRQLVIVRMGLTPTRLSYHPEALVHAVLEAAVPAAEPAA